jgi:glutaredoxin-related protein
MDISENMLALKMFVNLRESHPAFGAVKSRGSIGLPCVVINGGEKVMFNVGEELLASLR